MPPHQLTLPHCLPLFLFFYALAFLHCIQIFSYLVFLSSFPVLKCSMLISKITQNIKSCFLIFFPKNVTYKRIIHPKLNSDVTDLENFSITSLAHQWILCSEWVPSKQLIKSSQCFTSNPHNTVHLLTSFEVKSCMFLRNLLIRYFNLIRLLLAKI